MSERGVTFADLGEKLKAAVQQLAKERDTSVSKVVKVAVRAYLKRLGRLR